MSQLILLRHGESTFNALGKFTGTTDVPLTDKGKQQAANAAELLKSIQIDTIFTSERIRAIDTFTIINNKLGLNLPFIKDHRLNEQDFGDLEGVEKEEAIRLFGEEQVLEWRRAFDAHPPRGERFLAVQTRVALCYEELIAPELTEGRNVLVVAHGNSLRALSIFLLKLNLSEIPTFELGNAEPMILDFAASTNTFTQHSPVGNDN